MAHGYTQEVEFDYGKWREEDAVFDHKEFDRMPDEAMEKAATLEEWMAVVSSADPDTPPFEPHAHHNRDGDQLEVYLGDGAYFGKRLCPGIVVHCSQGTGRVVGVTIEGIHRIMNDADRIQRGTMSPTTDERTRIETDLRVKASAKAAALAGADLSAPDPDDPAESASAIMRQMTEGPGGGQEEETKKAS